MTKISGYVPVRNAIKLDYCIEECVRSLIPVCDEVVVCDSESNDGTREALEALDKMDSRVRVIERPWPYPVGDPTWYTTWLNHIREQLKYPIQLQLDADEVLCMGAYPTILTLAKASTSRFEIHGERSAFWFHRLNFWKDPQHLAPHHDVCAHMVVRMGPSNLWMPSDEPHPEGEPEIRKIAGWPPEKDHYPELRIFHYGFLRKNKAMIEKIKVLGGAFFNTYDARVAASEAAGEHWTSRVHKEQPLIEYNGGHPELGVHWLRARGYTL